MSTYNVNFIAFGNVKGGRCLDAELQLNMILEDGAEVVCITPYTLVTPGKPAMISGNPTTTPPSMIPGFTVVSKHEAEGETSG
jgi:hypothetical protein